MLCRICQSRLKFKYAVNNSRGENGDVFYCQKCDAFFVEESEFDYKCHDVVKYYEDHKFYIKNRYEKFFSFVERFVSPSSFLDIGSGMGYSLEVAQSRGWNAYGIEPNVILTQNCINRGLSVQNSKFSFGENSCYRLISMDNVLEHVRNPVEFVYDASRCLEKGGMLVIAVPPVDWLRKVVSSIALVRENVTIPQLNIFYDMTQHINFFSRNSIYKVANELQLTVIKHRYHHSIFYNNIISRLFKINDGFFFLSK